jgi:transmembrane sensor
MKPFDRDCGAEKSASEHSALDWARDHGAVHDVLAVVESELRRRQTRRRRLAFSGVLLVALSGLGVGLLRIEAPSPEVLPVEARVAQLEMSKPSKEVLPDGTVMELREGALARVDYAGPLRRVWLLKGEAYFTVASNPERPFVVQASGVDVRAVGTAFAVRLDRADVAVLVTEGRVAVSETAGDAPRTVKSSVLPPYEDRKAVMLGAGQRVVMPASAFDVEARLEQVSEPERSRDLAWRVPRLELNDTPLAEVIAVFNAQPGSPRLILVDPRMSRLPLSGVLQADNVDVLLRLLEESYGLRAEKEGGALVLRWSRR